MIEDCRPERIEQERGLEELQVGRRADVPHPPQVPEEAVVIAGIAGNGVGKMPDERPGPNNGERREQQRGWSVQPRCNSEFQIATFSPPPPPEAVPCG